MSISLSLFISVYLSFSSDSIFPLLFFAFFNPLFLTFPISLFSFPIDTIYFPFYQHFTTNSLPTLYSPTFNSLNLPIPISFYFKDRIPSHVSPLPQFLLFVLSLLFIIHPVRIYVCSHSDAKNYHVKFGPYQIDGSGWRPNQCSRCEQ